MSRRLLSVASLSSIQVENLDFLVRFYEKTGVAVTCACKVPWPCFSTPHQNVGSLGEHFGLTVVTKSLETPLLNPHYKIIRCTRIVGGQ